MHLRRSLFAVAVVLRASAPAFAAAPVNAESTISAVTVYVDRAIVTRTAKVELPEGTQDIRFAGLPDSLEPDLLQVSGTGIAEAMILEVRAVADQLEAPANPRLKELQEQVRGIQAELRVLTDRDAALKLERALLERITIAATTPPGEEGGALPTVDQWERLMVFYADRLARVATRAQEIDHDTEGVQARLSAAQREIGELQPQTAQAVKDVVVRVDVTKAGSLDLKLAYTVNNATWTPTYDVRVTSATKKISLGYSAMVRQSTGEDWHAVKLTLSTAQPAIGGTPPELSTWYVAKAEPRAYSRAGAVAPASNAPIEADDEKIVLSPYEVAKASVEAGLTAATFTVAHPTDIPADNAEHKIPITAHELDAELTHLTVPKLAELAYLRAAVTNTSPYPLISGPVNLYLDGTFVARSKLRTVMPNEKFDLDLGVDDGVAVKRQLRNRLTEDTGLVSSKQRVTYDILITVQNNRPAPIKLVVKDQLPVSKHERIAVDLLDPPSRLVKRDEGGTLTWTLDLGPGEKRELPLKIAVEYPADLPVEGLE